MAYSLTGVGFHGVNGLEPIRTKAMVQLYIIPRLIYGLEALTITQKQRSMMDQFYRDLIRRLQSLPERTAKPAIYILLGSAPLEASLDTNTLTFFGKIATDKGSVLHQIAARQLAVKSMDSRSWLVYIVKLCHKYCLPSPHEMLIHPMTIKKWESLVKRKVLSWWEDNTRLESRNMSSLRHLNNNSVSFKQAHHVWRIPRPNMHSVDHARIKARLITGTYTLQANRARFEMDVNPTCLLCNTEPETCIHFVSVCPALHDRRLCLLAALTPFLKEESMSILEEQPATMTQLVLDHTHPGVQYLLNSITVPSS
jgi:hypothetical protein